MKITKIVCTIGPASEAPEKLAGPIVHTILVLFILSLTPLIF